MNLPKIINKTFDFELGSFAISPTYWQAAAIVFLIFLLIVSLAHLRRTYIHWSFKSAGSMFFMGFLFTLILEGFLLVGGRTLLTEILGWENAPKPISTALDAGREKLVGVLGVTEEIPSSLADEPASAVSVVEDFESLNSSETKKARSLICEP